MDVLNGLFLADLKTGGGSQVECFLYVCYPWKFDWGNRFRWLFFDLEAGAGDPLV